MLALRSLFYLLLTLPIKLLVRCKIVPDDFISSGSVKTDKPIFYVVRHQSASDLLSLQKACKKLGLPDPLEHVEIKGKTFNRTLCIDKPTPLFKWRKAGKTNAIEQGLSLLEQHRDDLSQEAQLIPVNLTWGRAPTVEKNNANVGTILADQESPTWLRKFFIVLFLGRHTLVRFSNPVSLRYMADKHGSDEDTAHKLLRVARFHFHRQTIAATGPRLMDREQMFTALFANPSIKRVIADEAKAKNLPVEKVKKQAKDMMYEIAGDYRESMIRVGERVLGWLFNRLYNNIEVKNTSALRQAAEDGHEIIYVPCHRSHMDYLLLTYVIYHQGLVTPRIAAGINLNFWPAGPIFRKAGAFFIRRSFGGNRLYSAIFREYLGLLFDRGYSVKYYTEGGRSRTGRLLAPKTGMLAMTIQSLLRGIDRPLTLVPVYIGYEHVMEVATYHKELSGSKKKNESILGVLGAIKKLRNYGKGFVNFGEPIHLNQYLNDQVPQWKEDIDPVDPQKPSWLTPTVNGLGDVVMTKINKSAALNAVSLAGLILHATDNQALAQGELEAQMDFFLETARLAPYSDAITIPEESGKALVEHLISLNKVTVDKDSLGAYISLKEGASLEMRYYRNNILHTFLLPSLVCRILANNHKMARDEIIEQAQLIWPLLKAEFFLWQDQETLAKQVDRVLSALELQQVAKSTKAGFWSLTDDVHMKAYATLMSDVIDETIQRLVIVSQLTARLAPISKKSLEQSMVSIAQRLSVLNNINAPEFIEPKAQSALINAMKDNGYIKVSDNNELIAQPSLEDIKKVVSNLVSIDVLQSITR
ncbi:glycerol-3-phosphate 1-O-acyltransferase PlsB [Thalassotalea sp. LPB0316]|uniref:glycerol-3-phosphate 1-O-acyltransferase PlsB n=1 Tax=Thalassotalea sp. LPB0316 TaxID=2769490 RepID=UPI001866D2E0|nr:glycerol-3-phosphate 1-O-acyltransferase PlsB [Thalassotalea sp. LPB0316]QOL26481.1 glycerol-3-phosphate 1-O-acyltransferase PlsB [Thalassotalea sp. LPB0316]